METGVLIAESANDLLELLVNRYVDKMTTNTIREYKTVRIAPCVTGC